MRIILVLLMALFLACEGPVGPPGEKGDKGEAGEQGPQGEPGQDGLNLGTRTLMAGQITWDMVMIDSQYSNLWIVFRCSEISKFNIYALYISGEPIKQSKLAELVTNLMPSGKIYVGAGELWLRIFDWKEIHDYVGLYYALIG